MKQYQIEVIGSDLLQESIDHDIRIGTILIGNAARSEPNFTDQRILFARDSFERGDDVRVSAVQIGQVEDANASIEGAMEQLGKLLLAHAGLVGFAIATLHPGADA